jgi:hypothetical protein
VRECISFDLPEACSTSIGPQRVSRRITDPEAEHFKAVYIRSWNLCDRRAHRHHPSEIPPSRAPYSACFAMSSIKDIPVELLIDIFEKCSWTVPLAPLTLSSVCRMWHDIVYASPRVWQSISLQGVRGNQVATVDRLQRQTSLWLTNSSPQPFDVSVDFQFCSQERLLAVIFILIGGLNRWRSWTLIRGKHKEITDVAGIVLAASAHLDSSDEESDSDSEGEEQGGPPRLYEGTAVVNHLEMIVDETVMLGQRMDDESSSDGEDDDLERRLPKFGSERNGSIILRYPVPHLPLPSQVNPIGITSLTITEPGTGLSQPNPVQFLRFLTAFPEIETLTFDGCTLQPCYDEDDVPPFVTLPKLLELVVRNTRSIRMILSHFIVPALTKLTLQCLNTDTTVPDQPTGEDGDSEDEAHDYSQSPLSDHATGMGLRTLQKRSNPPLRELYMDYSDLRTKDFLFCFDHFSLLTKFRIVASDLSDKVIEMLAPHNDPSGRREIRLPHLKELELSLCQRVSGSAIVNALRERVSFVDRSPTHPRMGHVSVAECAGVLPEHNIELSGIFGSRFHL